MTTENIESQPNVAGEPLTTIAPAHPGWIMVVAASDNDTIGRNNTLPWKLRSDLQRFKRLTMGHCLLMGRNTYESIGRPLPGRQTVVLSRSGFRANHDAVAVLADTGDLHGLVPPERRIMVVGGAQVYQACMPLCNTIWLTRVHQHVHGDTFLPQIPWDSWRLVSSEAIPADEHNEYPSAFEVWLRHEPTDT